MASDSEGYNLPEIFCVRVCVRACVRERERARARERERERDVCERAYKNLGPKIP